MLLGVIISVIKCLLSDRVPKWMTNGDLIIIMHEANKITGRVITTMNITFINKGNQSSR